MFHSGELNNKINSIQGRALRIIYNDSKSTFEELLNKDNSVSIHHRNLQVSATKTFKIKNNMAPECLHEIFQNRALLHNLRTNSNFLVVKYTQCIMELIVILSWTKGMRISS